MEATAIFGHQEFRGVRYGAIVSVRGDEWPLTHPYVITGHIHDYQELQPNILYPGIPIQHSFGDSYNKTVSYFTFMGPKERHHERISLGLPRKQIIRISVEEVPTFDPSVEGDLKISIRGTTPQIKAIMKHPKIKIWEAAGHRIAYKHLPEERRGGNEGVDEIRAPLRFAAVLATTIAADPNPRLQPLFTQIFGGTVGPRLKLCLAASSS
jgi:DNA repair exonuclease SbcCD nuclease subunit